MTGLRVAGAPISWGVSEVPGWGHQLTTHRVLTEMRALGLEATEFGPDGFLPVDPFARAMLLQQTGLRAVGGFLPVVLHDPHSDPVPQVEEFVEAALVAGANVAVLAAATGTAGYDDRRPLGEHEWSTLLANLDRISEATARQGAVTALHPHVGTMVERADEVARVLGGSSVGLCVDTGHLLAGGTDPLDLVREHPGRVVHVHLKDLDSGLAGEVRAGRLTYTEAIPRGLFTPLGGGDIDVSALVSTLLDAGYDGWFVLEQDVMLAAEPVGAGPAADVRTSLDYLRTVVR
jgi:inosose dehydratase